MIEPGFAWGGVVDLVQSLYRSTLGNCRIHLPTWLAEFLRKYEPDGLSLRSLQQFSKLESLVRMIKSIVSIAFATALMGSVAFAQTPTKVAAQPNGVTEINTTTESLGTVTEFTPGDTLTLKTEATEPMHYTFSKTVEYVNAHGKVIEASKIRKDSKVRVHYLRHGNAMVVDKVMLTPDRH
jgi:hypothetical protein